MNHKNAKIIIATHKEYEMPQDSLYLPVHVGAEGKNKLPYQPDNTGENISIKNSGFCELTGLYWAWKNLDCDVLGLAHYRRHFTVKSPKYIRQHKPMECVLSTEELDLLLSKYHIIVPQKRNYVIETLKSHYAHTHYQEHLDITGVIISELCPEYRTDYYSVLEQRSGYMFNMFVMDKELANEYCTWLFEILFELEKRIGEKSKEYSAFQTRFYGRVSEVLFNVWLKHKQIPVKEIGYLSLERVNWVKKGFSFLAAKFLGKKYSGSF